MPRGPKRPPLSVVVGIDPSATGTGLAAIDTHTGGLVGTTRLRPKLTGVDRLDEIRVLLRSWLEGTGAHTIDHVCLEGYAFSANRGAGSQSHKLGEVGGVIKLSLFDLLRAPAKYPSIPVIQQLKKFATGKGTAPKDQVSKAVHKKWKVDLPTSDEADAYALAQIALSIVTGQTATSYERDVLDAMEASGSIWAEMPPELRYELGVGVGR